ncbi:hypothetical protein TGS27_2715 [Geobacillus stearothermophilus]|nr:hypothetical protein TGS27_2715 [Geobacillus stearothermophilus]
MIFVDLSSFLSSLNAFLSRIQEIYSSPGKASDDESLLSFEDWGNERVE